MFYFEINCGLGPRAKSREPNFSIYNSTKILNTRPNPECQVWPSRQILVTTHMLALSNQPEYCRLKIIHMYFSRDEIVTLNKNCYNFGWEMAKYVGRLFESARQTDKFFDTIQVGVHIFLSVEFATSLLALLAKG